MLLFLGLQRVRRDLAIEQYNIHCMCVCIYMCVCVCVCIHHIFFIHLPVDVVVLFSKPSFELGAEIMMGGKA